MPKILGPINLADVRVGEPYSRQDIARVGGLPIPDPVFGSGWDTGVLELENAVLLFVTLQKTSADDYVDEFDGREFFWESQNRQTQDTPVIASIANGDQVAHLFARLKGKDGSLAEPFIYCGRLGRPAMEGNNPVTCLFEVLDYQENPSAALAAIYNWRAAAAPPENERRQVSLKTNRTGQRVGERNRAKYWHVADAVAAIGPATVSQIGTWLAQTYPDEVHSDLTENLSHITVNSPSRVHYDRARKNWRSDSDHPRDRLFKLPTTPARYELYEPERHGWVDLQKIEGRWKVVPLQISEFSRAESEGQQAAERSVPPVDSEHDARVWIMRAVALRRGQNGFRESLLSAYENTCPISGCRTVSVLEAAHILPYKGDHTNRVDNGLLLRSDLHTLFDLGLLWIDHDMRVRLSRELLGGDYATYEALPLRLPKHQSDRPNPDHLAAHASLADGRALVSQRSELMAGQALAVQS
ncbi:HNH endonuclease [Stenotrophomonas tumulicola]|uniref:DUF3427 domain-containing protein n=1 Tax=Stenotrophomonas tumulicola TaxID=1685415 RepID=A0A7W3FP97_9GAMM|nr:HNH endonuclease [Stenotrophomonas tumulicola]MBA8683115.1 DUF3427 domain-containing protein [Stenotrophomonas tumulicola]